jgi:U-box domain
MIMESKPVLGLEQEDDTNSSTECADEYDDVDEADQEDDEDDNNTTDNNNEYRLKDDTELVVPSKFICPLTLDIMKDPLISRHGQSYERRAIMEWIHQGNSTCPMTRQPLRLSGLITNHSLKAQIQQWKKENNYNSSSKNNTSKSQVTNDNNTKKKKKKQESTERILGMYCNFMEETTDRSRDDPPVILEWRRPASLDEDAPTTSRPSNNTIRNFFTRFRSKHSNSNNAAPTAVL